MARADITKTLSPGKRPPTTGGTVVTWQAADTTNFEQVSLTDQDSLLVWNSHASTGYTYTVTSVPDEYGRSGDMTTIALAAGVFHVVGNGMAAGWLQTNGKLYLQASNAAVKWAVITRQ